MGRLLPIDVYRSGSTMVGRAARIDRRRSRHAEGRRSSGPDEHRAPAGDHGGTMTDHLTGTYAPARPPVDAGRLWAGGLATAAVAALITVVGVLVSRGL